MYTPIGTTIGGVRATDAVIFNRDAPARKKVPDTRDSNRYLSPYAVSPTNFGDSGILKWLDVTS